MNESVELNKELTLTELKKQKNEIDRFCAEAALAITQATIHLADTAIAVLQVVARNSE